MKAEKGYIERKFAEFNRRMFGGRLPAIPVRMADSTTSLGMCVAKIRRHPDGQEEYYDFELRISRLYDLPEKEVEDVLIHEMIHYFIMYNGLCDSSPHGEIFRTLMNRINAAYGRRITVSHRSSSEERAAVRAGKKRWHVIAKVRMTDGSYGVKVLPRVIPKILDYYRTVLAAPTVAAMELYLHDNTFFNRFPTSSAYRVSPLEESVLSENLRGAHRLKVEGDRLIQL